MEAINKSFEAHNKNGARSNAKLKPVHAVMDNYLQEYLDKDYKIYSPGFQEDKKYTIEAKYYREREDIVAMGPDILGVLVVDYNNKTERREK